VDEKIQFNLMVPGQRPKDAILILEADVSRIDGTVSNWRCYDEACVKHCARLQGSIDGSRHARDVTSRQP
jgi:hypothetical protein